MNFLAHFHLAWPDEGLLAGALEGDFHKGPVTRGLHPELAPGVQLHRAIDAYTDSHPLIAALRADFPPTLRRYAGILIDLSFDHYLSRHWHRYSELALPQFNSEVHHRLASREQRLSAGSRAMLRRLREHDILNRYHDWQMVTASAARIGERFRRGNPLLAVDGELGQLRQALEDAFLEFYPELQEFSRNWQRPLNQTTRA